MTIYAIPVLFFYLLISAFSNSLFAQNNSQTVVEEVNEKALILYQNKENQAAKNILVSLDSLINHDTLDSTSAYSYYLLGNTCYRLRLGNEGLKWHKKALAWREEHFTDPHIQKIQSYEWIGNIYRYTLRQPYAAIPFYEQALEQAEKDLTIDPDAHRRLTYNMAATYRLVKDMDRALQYGTKSLNFALESPENKTQLASHYNQMGTLYVTNKAPQKALYNFQKALNILPIDEQHLNRRFRYRSNLSDVNRELGNFELAQEIQLNNLKDILATNPKSGLLGTVYYTLLKGAHQMKNYDKVDHYASLSIKAFEKSHGKKHIRVAEIYRYWGAAYRTQPIKAIPKLDSALKIHWPTLIVEEQEFPLFPKQVDWEALFITLGHKAFALRHKTPCDTSILKEALKYHAKTLEAYQKYRLRFLSKKGIIDQAKQHNWFWEEAMETIELALSKNENKTELLSMAWLFMESGKSVLLQQQFKRAEAKIQETIPDSLFDEYLQLIHLQETCKASDSLYLIQREMSKWKRNIGNSHPAFGRYLAQSNEVSLDSVLKELDTETTLINYWEGQHSVYVLGIQLNKQQFFSIPKNQQWTSAIQSFQNFVEHINPEQIKRIEANNAIKSGNFLYQSLIAPINNNSSDDLIIMPHKNLEKIPFESLLLDSLDINPLAYHTYPYLIKENAIHYAFSGSHWINSHQLVKERTQQSTISMAGFSYGLFEGSEKFSSLPASNKEIIDAAKHWDGDIYSETNASKSQFKKRLLNTDLIHIAMHGQSSIESTTEPMLVFPQSDSLKDGFLHLSELYGMTTNSRLIIMNACETGSGEFASGEGVLSLARGFTFAGCPSVVSSLWPLYDGSSSKMMKVWHKQIAEGKPLNIALQKSKIDYLSKASPLEAHPSQWAGMILIGESSPIKNQNSNSIFTILIFIALAFTLLLIIGRFF